MKLVVRELIQNKLNSITLKKELDKLLNELAYRNSIREDYKSLKEKLGGKGASRKAAEQIVNQFKDTD